jgi:hypothetical protein
MSTHMKEGIIIGAMEQGNESEDGHWLALMDSLPI